VVGSYTDPREALAAADQTKPDFAFLDIEMPEMTGIELAERLASVNPVFEVIFVTAYNHYAAQAFEVSALDYLLKPIRPERIDRAIEKLSRKMDSSQQSQGAACVIRCLGSFDVLVGGQPVKWGRSKSRELLAFMIENEGKWLSKYRLCAEQWPECGSEQALTNLQTCVYSLRKKLREAGCTQLEIRYSEDRYILRITGAELDVPKFECTYAAFCRTGSPEEANKALRLYTGDYLEGEDWPWSDILREEYILKYEELRAAAGYLPSPDA
jgi:two-component SAPR family response regulator